MACSNNHYRLQFLSSRISSPRLAFYSSRRVVEAWGNRLAYIMWCLQADLFDFRRRDRYIKDGTTQIDARA